MKKITSTLICFVLTSCSLFSQGNYYWGDGKKINLKEDKTSMVIYEKNNKNSLTFIDSNKVIITEKFSKKLGQYKILKVKDSNTDMLSLNEDNVKAKKNAYVSEFGDTLYLTNYIFLKFKIGSALNDIEKIMINYNVTHKETKYNVFKMEVPDINNVLLAANEIYESGIVEWCRPNFLRKLELHSEPRDKQYYIHNKNHYCGAFDNDINALEAWEITTGCANIRVAVIDDGVEDHPELRDLNGNSRVANGYSVPGMPSNGRPGISDYHGESVAGIIAASHSNNIRGIAPNVTIVPVNLGFDIEQDEDEWFDAINWAWEANGGNADILSNSWGPTEGTGGNELLIEAINNAKTFGRGGDFSNNIPGLGAVVFFSSGNNGLDEVSDYAKAAIAVGAIDKEDTPAKGLDGVPNVRYTNIGVDQDLVAYGGSVYQSLGTTDIRTIDRVGENGKTSGDYSDEFGGTSAACPMVSGAAALILSINPSLTRTQVENILFSTATDLGNPGRDNTYGYGKLNIYAACKEAVNTRTNSFILNKGYLTYTKIRDNSQTIFSSSPGCGIAAATYFCDVYKFNATAPLNSVYIGDGLSGANPNNGEYYVSITNNGTNTYIQTFFYYIRSNIIGQTINKWVPQNPADLWSREYLSPPLENITFNGVINSGVSKELVATNSITLESGFETKEGSYFLAQIASKKEDITCLTNPTNNITLNSQEVEYINNTMTDYQGASSKLSVDKNENIIIYPNPNKGNFIINIQGDLSDDAKVEIYSIDGNLKYRSAIISKQHNVIFTSISGLYLIRIYNNNKYYTEKIILK